MKKIYNVFFTKKVFYIVLIFFYMNCFAKEIDSTKILAQNLIKAQAAYYKYQCQEKSTLDLYLPYLIPFISTIIGAFIAFFAVKWSHNSEWKLEKEKWLKAQENDAKKELRTAIADLNKKISAEMQTIRWLTWKAKYNSNQFLASDIDEYNRDMKNLLLEDIVAKTFLLAIDKDIHDKMKVFSDKVSTIDHNLSLINARYTKCNDEAEKLIIAKEIGEFYNETLKLETEFTEQLGNILM